MWSGREVDYHMMPSNNRVTFSTLHTVCLSVLLCASTAARSSMNTLFLFRHAIFHPIHPSNPHTNTFASRSSNWYESRHANFEHCANRWHVAQRWAIYKLWFCHWRQCRLVAAVLLVVPFAALIRYAYADYVEFFCVCIFVTGTYANNVCGRYADYEPYHADISSLHPNLLYSKWLNFLRSCFVYECWEWWILCTFFKVLSYITHSTYIH